ncbi:MAG: ATP synthase F1 subunit delta, partial [Chloroflexota bacterium]
MLRGTAARRYAEGTFAIARDANSYDRWLADLDTIVSAFSQPLLARYLTDPKPTLAQKETVVRQALEPRVEKLALNLALLLVRRGHTSSATALRREFQAMVYDARNVAVAEVTTAIPLEAAQTASLKARLERLTSKTIELDMRVDAA